MPFAARMSDMHSCPMQNPTVPPTPHIGGAITSGNSSILINKMPAAAIGDSCFCAGSPDTITSGSSSVFIGKKPMARIGDSTAHGGIITSGELSVIIGG
ncbi:type VI secretion protein [Fibrobacterales bacterium]|nr:type VI secretion protein [Fibrobacterales bacterium]